MVSTSIFNRRRAGLHPLHGETALARSGVRGPLFSLIQPALPASGRGMALAMNASINLE
jgi:hypothetical protein